MKGGKSKAKLDNKLAVKKGNTDKKKQKAAKDPNKPKRPPTAFFVFMEEFRKTFKENNPGNKSVSVVGKAGGVEWKNMSESDKAPYKAKADKRKREYEKTMEAYNNKETVAPVEEEESDKSKSEIHDNNEDEDSAEEGSVEED
ncbi:unnamed protein product [Cuscuta epithymum]|uniref:HMG box domain-containing protein n=1 Tax=Cuscuta epithymum TaxID=186058 RepID=A0AAV0FD58_9ASTE|nr:unnamed protein product [Cuscuta epithymum]CAH9133504.1 unnamed protein product [Cuscuta epithymum]